MGEVLNIVNINPIKNAYRERNILYKRYISDIVERSLKKSIHDDRFKHLITSNIDVTKLESMYLVTAEAIVNDKFRRIDDDIKREYGNEALYTIEPVDPELISTDIEALERVYFKDRRGIKFDLATLVKKELTELITDVTLDLLETVKNKAKNFTNEFSKNVRELVSNIDNNGNIEIKTTIMGILQIDEDILEYGVVSKRYSNNYTYDFSREVKNMDTTIFKDLDMSYFNPENIDINKFDLNIDSTVKEYLSDLEVDVIEDFIEDVSSYGYTDIYSLINELASLGVIKKLEPLRLLWIYLIQKVDEDPRINSVLGLIESYINRTVSAIRNNKELLAIRSNEIIRVGSIRTELPAEIILIDKSLAKITEKYPNAIKAIIGEFIKTEVHALNISDLSDDEIKTNISYYEKYMTSLRYKDLVKKVSELRDAYILGLTKLMRSFNDYFGDLTEKYGENIYIIKNNLLDIVTEYVNGLSIDELLNVEETTYKIVKEFILPDILATIESFMKAGEERFKDDDDILIFTYLNTLVEIVFSLFTFRVLNKID